MGDTAAPAVWFAYSPDRKGENPRQHLAGYKGALQADAYAGFQQLYATGAIAEVACWAQTRRKFHEIHIAHASPITTEAIERIAAIYAIEAEIHGSTADLRRTIRQGRARPLLDSLFLWFETTLAKLSRKSDTAGTIRYADDGQLEIDNNTAERALHVVTLGHKTTSSADPMPAENVPHASTPARFSQTQQPRSQARPAPLPRMNRQPSHQLHPRTPAMEHSDPYDPYTHTYSKHTHRTGLTRRLQITGQGVIANQ